MKRILTLFVTLLISLYSLQGYSQLLLGVRGGQSISGITFTPEQDTRPLTNPLIDVGLILKHFAHEHVGFQGELNYTQRGYLSFVDSTYYYKRVNSFVEIPLFFQVRTTRNSFFAHVNIGFSASFLTHSKAGQGTTISQIELSNYKLNVLRDNYFNYGLKGGVGLGYDFSWGTIQLDVRYLYGLGDLYYYNYSGNPTRSPAWALNGSVSLMFNLSNAKKERAIFEDNRDISPDINQI